MRSDFPEVDRLIEAAEQAVGLSARPLANGSRTEAGAADPSLFASNCAVCADPAA
jgi:hypothetical protein